MPGAIFTDQDGNEVFLHEDEYAAGLTAGLKPRDGAIPAETLVGKTEYVPQTDLAFDPGVRTLGPEERNAYWQQRAFDTKYGGTGNAIASGIEGALDTLTLGGSAWLEREAGMDVSERAQAHPLAHTIGGVAGALATLPLGGEGFAAEGASLASKGIGGAQELGALSPLGRAVGAAKRIAGPGLLGNVGEGVVFGLGQASSNLALSNESLTAEAVWSELGNDATTGAVLGLGGGLVGRGLEKLASKGRSIETAALRRAAANEVTDLSSEAGTSWARDLRRISGQTDDLVKQAARGATEKTSIAESPLTAETAAARGGNELEQLEALRAQRSAIKKKIGSLQSQLETAAPGKAAKLEARIEDFQGKLDELDDALAVGQKNVPVGQFSGDDVANHWKFSQGLAEDSAGFRPNAKLSRRLNELRREMVALGGATDSLGREKLSSVGEVAWADDALKIPGNRRKIATLLDKYRKTALEYAEDSGLGVPREFAPAITHDAETVQAYLKAPEVAEAASIAPEVVLAENPAELVQQAKAAQNSYRRVWGTGGTDILSAEAINKFANKELPDALHALDVLGKYHDSLGALGGKSARAVEDLNAQFAKLGADNPKWASTDVGQLLTDLGFKSPEVVQEAASKYPDLLKLWVARASQNTGKAGASSFWTKVIARRSAGALGGAIGGPLGYAAGETAAQLALNSGHLAEFTGKAIGRISRAVDRLAKGVRSGLPTKTTLEVLNNYNRNDKAKDIHTAFKKRSADIAQLAANPQLSFQLADYAHAAGITGSSLGVADKFIARGERALQFLNAQAPKDPGEIQTLGKSRWRATDGDIHKWAEMLRAVSDPVSVIEGVASGSVSPSAVFALKELSPATLEEAQRQILSRLPEIQENATYDQQIRLGILFDMPVNSSARPRFVSFIQSKWSELDSQQPMKIDAKTQPTPDSLGNQLLAR